MASDAVEKRLTMIGGSRKELGTEVVDVDLRGFVNAERADGVITNIASRRMVRFLNDKTETWTRVTFANHTGPTTVAPPYQLVRAQGSATLPRSWSGAIAKPARGTNGGGRYPVVHTDKDLQKVLASARCITVVQRFVDAQHFRVMGLLGRNGTALLSDYTRLSTPGEGAGSGPASCSVWPSTRSPPAPLQRAFDAIAESATSHFERGSRWQFFSADALICADGNCWVIDVNPGGAQGLIYDCGKRRFIQCLRVTV